MTNEELDEARATKAYIAYAGGTFGNGHTLATIAARIAREQEQERTNLLVVFADQVRAGVFIDLDEAKRQAAKALAAYKRAAR
jgi:signal recognition particle GTPase